MENPAVHSKHVFSPQYFVFHYSTELEQKTEREMVIDLTVPSPLQLIRHRVSAGVPASLAGEWHLSPSSPFLRR